MSLGSSVLTVLKLQISLPELAMILVVRKFPRIPEDCTNPPRPQDSGSCPRSSSLTVRITSKRREREAKIPRGGGLVTGTFIAG